jgi:predicted DCC family thiol-disulfide oxidoreductase YuxK
MSTLASHPILLFDGVCNLCNGFVKFIIQRDPEGIFHFASLQSEAGQALLAEYSLPSESMDTTVLIENGKAYTHADVALLIAPRLSLWWSWVRILWLVPRPVRNVVYNWVAQNRYRWFGKQEACLLPRPEWKARFVE